MCLFDNIETWLIPTSLKFYFVLVAGRIKEKLLVLACEKNPQIYYVPSIMVLDNI